MKKLIVFLLALTMLAAVAHAEIDLPGMTYDELVALKDQINLAIWNSQEWQEVTVPQGLWKVGEDIPAGHWTVRCADEGIDGFMKDMVQIEWGDKLTESGGISIGGRYGAKNIYHPKGSGYTEAKISEWDFEWQEGDYVYIATSYNRAIFTPYAGKPSLGFK